MWKLHVLAHICYGRGHTGLGSLASALKYISLKGSKFSRVESLVIATIHSREETGILTRDQYLRSSRHLATAHPYGFSLNRGTPILPIANLGVYDAVVPNRQGAQKPFGLFGISNS